MAAADLDRVDRARRRARRASARCRTRCCRSTASARSASSPSQTGAKLLIVPSARGGASTTRRWPRDDRGGHAAASRCSSSTRTCPRATRRRCPAPPVPTAESRPTVRALGLLHVGHHRRPEGRAPHRQDGRRRRRTRWTGAGDDRRGPQRDGVPVHAHRRDRLAVRRAHGRLRARRSSRRSSPPTTIPVLRRERVTIAGAGTAFHLAYLAAQRSRARGEPLFPEVARVRRRRRGQAAAAALRGEGRAGRRRHRERATASPRRRSSRWRSIHDPDEKLADTEGQASIRAST